MMTILKRPTESPCMRAYHGSQCHGLTKTWESDQCVILAEGTGQCLLNGNAQGSADSDQC
jgi:hypothetical protein